jgi:hypothetical protein
MWGRFGDRKHEKAKKEAFHVQLSRFSEHPQIKNATLRTKAAANARNELHHKEL